MNLIETLNDSLKQHPSVLNNLPRRKLIQACIDNKEAILTKNGALATWRAPESTGRSPKDTVIVRRADNEQKIDWDSPNNIPITEETFNMAWNEAVDRLFTKNKIYITDRVVGADPSYALPVKTICDQALTILFTDNMFRKIPEEINSSVFAGKGFTILVLPLDKLDRSKFDGRLRKIDGKTSNMIVAIDFDRRLGLVYGSAYCGSVKKSMFTVMNYYLPEEKILPLHCSANEGSEGDIALLLGLSGTGKTTLSADPSRALLGDDEHGWGDKGIANFEGGCYAKLIDLDPSKEPEIYEACFGKRAPLENGAILEDAMIFPDGSWDLYDDRYTPNSRGSYPLEFLSNIKPSSVGNHPKTILFLTADANGVLPPLAKLNREQAMLWFLMGYTSKLAGTETGIVDPESTFSRFFGAPFMPRIPDDYTTLLGEKMDRHDVNVFLINTGWTGGMFGVGKRMDINLTRRLVEASLSGELNDTEFVEDSLFHLSIPKECSGVPSDILFPKNTWNDKKAFEEQANKLANDFKNVFEKLYLSKVDSVIAQQCPGR